MPAHAAAYFLGGAGRLSPSLSLPLPLYRSLSLSLSLSLPESLPESRRSLQAKKNIQIASFILQQGHITAVWQRAGVLIQYI